MVSVFFTEALRLIYESLPLEVEFELASDEGSDLVGDVAGTLAWIESL